MSNISLLTDLYEFTMGEVYFKKGLKGTAVFEFFLRDNKHRNYFVSAGLYELLNDVLNFSFDKEDIEYLRSTKKFSEDFLNYLKSFKFTGNIYAMEEGEIFFTNEPVIIVEAPIIQAQLLETFLINQMHISILIASKAMRCYFAAKGKLLVEFGLRRAHGTDAGLKASRNSFLAGFDGTSNTLAGKLYSIPVFGTMAHSFVMAYPSEIEAFLSFASIYRENSIFLVDTYNILEGVKNAVKAAKALNIKTFKGIRIDSEDILELSKEARKILDQNQYKDATIFVSGNMNEYKIKDFLDKKAPIDGFGVGTELVVSSDSPYLDCAYKLVEYDKEPKIKLSKNKITIPGKKQVYRVFENGKIKKDTISLFDEKIEGEALLKPFVINGELVKDIPSLYDIKQKALKSFNSLPDNLKDIYEKQEFMPELSFKVKDLLKSFGAYI